MCATRLTNGSVGSSPARLGLQNHSLSWTDDLPVCKLSGVGFSTNQLYREDGNRREEHEFEDRSFHFCLDDNCFLYGVFDGHDGSKAANFAAQRMPAELLLGQLSDRCNGEETKEVLNQAFIAVEKGFFESIDDILADRTSLQLQLPEGVSAYDAYRQYPDIYNKVQALDSEMSGGTTATVCLVYRNKLFVANVGDTRALLCTTDEANVLRVTQLTEDHVVTNEDEVYRLSQIGLDADKLQQFRTMGTTENSRCIGDYHVKGGYKDNHILSSASCEPIIAEPYVHDGIELDNSCAFLIVMSDGLYQALQAANGTDRVNAEIASMVATEFSVQSTLNGVAQAVVDRVVRIHHDAFMMGTLEIKQICQKRGDITLLVRNFNYPLPNSISSPTRSGGNFQPAVPAPYYATHPKPGPVTIPLPSAVSSWSPNSDDTTPVEDTPTPSYTSSGSPSGFYRNTETNVTGSTNTGTYTNTSSTQSSDESRLFQHRFNSRSKLELDENGKIEPYVDFSEFYQAIAELTEAQRDIFEVETNPKSSYESISEESDSVSASET